jgi:hypothetical protein
VTPVTTPVATPVTVGWIEGDVASLRDTFGHIKGDDGRRYFFIPSYCLPQALFRDLRPGQRVRFIGRHVDYDQFNCPRYRAFRVELVVKGNTDVVA